MKPRWIEANGVSTHDLAELPDLREAYRRIRSGLTSPSGATRPRAFAGDFGFHSMANQREPKPQPDLHQSMLYPHHVFIVGARPRDRARSGICMISNWTSSVSQDFRFHEDLLVAEEPEFSLFKQHYAKPRTQSLPE